jgi:hypothetical protein
MPERVHTVQAFLLIEISFSGKIFTIYYLV